VYATRPTDRPDEYKTEEINKQDSTSFAYDYERSNRTYSSFACN
jgi:hypothetical protein